MLTVHERRAEITALASNQGHASVAELAERFSVTPETIRRDLKYLESSGLVHRVHGGAVTNHTLRSDEQPFWVSEKSHSAEKKAIAQAAMPFIPTQSGSIVIVPAPRLRLSHCSWRTVTEVSGGLSSRTHCLLVFCFPPQESQESTFWAEQCGHTPKQW